MKLYTEEQVKKMIEKSQYTGLTADFLILAAPSVQLPSDEEIKKMMELDGMEFDEFDPYDVSYLGGATWMRNKIQGGKQ
jgi:hypothetical protein